MRSTATRSVGAGALATWTEPWDGLVLEERHPDGSMGCVEGPFRSYRRTVEVAPDPDRPGRHLVTSTVDFRLAIPWFGFLFAPLVARALRRPGAPPPWWGPSGRLDARASTALATVCAVAVVAGYLGTSITQSITFVTDGFGITDDRPQAFALATVRLAIVLSLVLVAVADRRGRRRLLLVAMVAGCLLSLTTAVSPDLRWFTASQVLVRGCSTAVAILVAVLAAEELPAGARAFGASVISMSGAFGAGLCVMALPVADLGDDGWRLLFVLPLLGLLVAPAVARDLPESRRFQAPHGDARLAGHGRRLLLLAISAFLVQLFVQPASQLHNEFLRDERGYDALGISLFTILTVTPAGVGILAGGLLADARGRRGVGAVALVGGTAATLVLYTTAGAAMWVASLVGSIVAAAAVPALGVYGPELFPTGLRARANGILSLTGVAGSATGLVVAGVLSDRFGSLAAALGVLAVGPLLLAAIVVRCYPETAGIELEVLNPEDAPATTSPPPPAPRAAPSARGGRPPATRA